MQEKYININKLKVSESLSRFVKDELLKDTNISSDDFWLGFEKTVEELEPKNRQLINFRETLQKKTETETDVLHNFPFKKGFNTFLKHKIMLSDRQLTL